jgi:hypothetical protein
MLLGMRLDPTDIHGITKGTRLTDAGGGEAPEEADGESDIKEDVVVDDEEIERVLLENVAIGARLGIENACVTFMDAIRQNNADTYVNVLTGYGDLNGKLLQYTFLLMNMFINASLRFVKKEGCLPSWGDELIGVEEMELIWLYDFFNTEIGGNKKIFADSEGIRIHSNDSDCDWLSFGVRSSLGPVVETYGSTDNANAWATALYEHKGLLWLTTCDIPDDDEADARMMLENLDPDMWGGEEIGTGGYSGIGVDANIRMNLIHIMGINIEIGSNMQGVTLRTVCALMSLLAGKLIDPGSLISGGSGLEK